jgi:hypothetical protein
MMKRFALSAALLLAPLAAAAANGPMDGAYRCNVMLGPEVAETYITIVGYPDGRSLFAVAAISTTQRLGGYGIGQVVVGQFSGTTSTGGAFTFVAQPGGMSGSVQILQGGSFVTGYANCSQVW